MAPIDSFKRLVELRKSQIKKGTTEINSKKYINECIKKYDITSKDLVNLLSDSICKHCSCNIMRSPCSLCSDTDRESPEHLCDTADVIRETINKKEEEYLTCKDCVDGGFCTEINRFWMGLAEEFFERYEQEKYK